MGNNKYKILIVEDEANIRSFIKANLETSDYQVLCAETGPQGPAGTTATNENAMLYNTDAQTIAAGGTLTLPANSINSTGSITASGTTGVTLAPGQYLVTFVSDANVAAAGTLGAALELGGAALPYAVTAETQDAAGADRITLTAIVTPTTAQPLTVINSSGSSNTYTNSTLTIVKLA